ncbi:Sugar phosphate isomerase/epimerase [Aquiflexum balticum DSM 16537]|uniref:Sugar phosphate isomerase/epimerase n=2 Tax=Aquiflexum TaxID=280472 RepID=A0A1W2H0X3_9BACT|nr:Sugar phosphate isomerase/epimerase [Aquiflexum balticum DSM 16537]
MNRRKFIIKSTLSTAGLGLMPAFSHSNNMKIANTDFGVALFTLPKALSEDFEGTIRIISEMGYKELEFFGPYDFSDEGVKKSWNQLTPLLGFSGSGYFGHPYKETREILDRYGLKAPAIHVDLQTLEKNMGQVAEAANVLGHKYVGIAMIPEEMRPDLEGYKKTIDTFNRVGASAKKYGLTFFYHNHGYGHKEMEGVVPFDLILKNTDPELVKMELDVFWFAAAGVDSKKILKENPGRFPLLHIKDMSEAKTFTGDGGNPSEWMSLFPYLTDAGDGVLDLPGILKQAKKSGVKHFFLEKDNTPEFESALMRSFNFLSKLKL